jgi:hypothetical protein
VLQGKYCHACGQKRIKAEDKKLKHFLEEFFASLFFADGKILRSFRLMFSKPGGLSRSYISGARKKYVSPLQMFFFANLLYFLFPLGGSFNTNLDSHLNHQIYSNWASERVQRHLEVESISYAEFKKSFERQSDQNGKLLLIILVFLQGLFMKLLFMNKKELYFTDFLAASAYFTAFYIFTLLIILPSLIFLINYLIDADASAFINLNELVLSIIILTLVVLFFYVFLKRAFQTKPIEALLRGIVLTVLMIPSFAIYRLVLFGLTYWLVA